MATRGVALSPTLAVNEAIARRRARGHDVIHLGFGEAGAPLHPMLVDALGAGAHHHGYPPVVGTDAVRQAAAGYLRRRGIAAEADSIIAAPGSKPLLHALIATLPGDVVLPAPSWVSYAAQAGLAGKNVIWVPIPPDTGGVPDPNLLGPALELARDQGMRPGILVLTMPDNPTGCVPPAEVVAEVCEIAAEYDLTIISDEIYRDLLHETDATITSPAELHPDRTVITNGLSKCLALGGWRFGFAAFPGTDVGRQWRDHVAGYASEVWSAAPAPVQHAAAVALSEPPELTAAIRDAATCYGAVMQHLRSVVVSAGATCRPPGGGFYLYPEFAAAAEQLAARGIHTSGDLAQHLIDNFGVAVLAGHHFGDSPHRLGFRLAGSMLLGADNLARVDAVRSADPAGLPAVRSAADRLHTALTTLLS